MKLLIITQVVDIEHPILGFFHRWIIEFAKHCEQIHVIALQVGTYDLPDNVTVHSLGKDQGKSKFVYLLRFYQLIWSLRHEYDNVFVHMNQLYVILGAPLWRILGKKVGLWYAHGTVSNSLRLAVFWATTIFTSTEEGMRIQTSKREIVGQGIDTDLFCLGDKKPSDVLRLITVGRISQSKNLETLIRASALLKEKGFLFSFSIVGNTLTEKDIEYKEKLKNLCAELHVEEHIQWAGSVTQKQLPALLQQSDIFIHDGATNSLDKALLEASLCGCIVVSSNPAYLSILNEDAEDFIFTPQNSKMLTNKIIKSIRNLPERIAEQTKSYHTVSRLIFSIIKKLTIKSH